MKNFEFRNLTDKGLVRQENEDFYGCFDTPNGQVFVVCDGMGGHKGGALAAQIAVSTVRDYFQTNNVNNIRFALQQAIQYANSAIVQRAMETPEFSGMGCTIVLLIIKEDQVYYAHVGDSRIYFQRKNNLRQITRDHSYVQELVDAGLISASEAAAHPKKNQITKALGVKNDVEASLCADPIVPEKDDLFLLCTDGLSGLITDAAINHLLSQKNRPLEETVASLVQGALNNGGSDNITVQLIRWNSSSRRKINPKMIGSGLALLALTIYAAVQFNLFNTKNTYPLSDPSDIGDSGQHADRPHTPEPAKRTVAGDPLPVPPDSQPEGYNKFDAPMTDTGGEWNKQFEDLNASSSNQNLPEPVKENPNMYPYKIRKGNTDKKMQEIFHLSWAKLSKGDPEYREKAPKENKTLNIHILAAFPVEEFETNRKQLENKYKPNQIVKLDEDRMVLIIDLHKY